MNCPHAGTCGGCSLLHLSYGAQLSTKEAALRELLGPMLPRTLSGASGSLFLEIPSLADDPMHFRQKVAFVFGGGPSRRDLTMGHYRRGSRQVVPVSTCPVHSDRGNRIAFALRDHLSRAGIGAAASGSSGILRHILVRTTADDTQAVAMLVVSRNDKALRGPVRAFLESAERPDGFFINVNTDQGPFMVGDHTIRIDGNSHIRETVGGIAYLVSPTAFFQTNVHAARVLQHYVVQSLQHAERVLDLYCGSGLFSLPLAVSGIRVTGVEENPQAIADAAANARLNRVPSSRARFIAASVETSLSGLRKEPWDGVILDPPRQGCSDQVLEATFQDLRPPMVTYVSCNPQSLAAELPGIIQCGYRIEDVRTVDMFPHTDHLEAVVTLRRS